MERLRETVLRPPLGDRFSVPKNQQTLTSFAPGLLPMVGGPSGSGGTMGGLGSMMFSPSMATYMGGQLPPMVSYNFPWMPPGAGTPGLGMPTMGTPNATSGGQPDGGGTDPGTPPADWDWTTGDPPPSPRTRVFLAEIEGNIPFTYDDVFQNGNSDVFPWRWKYKWTSIGFGPFWDSNPSGEDQLALNVCEVRNFYNAAYWVTGANAVIGPEGELNSNYQHFPVLAWKNSVTFPTQPNDPNESLHGAPLPIASGQQVPMIEDWRPSVSGDPTSPLTPTYWFHVVNARIQFPGIPMGGTPGQVLKVATAPGETTGLPLFQWGNA